MQNFKFPSSNFTTSQTGLDNFISRSGITVFAAYAAGREMLQDILEFPMEILIIKKLFKEIIGLDCQSKSVF